MKATLYPFLVLAACGFTLSVVAHALALAGMPPPGGNLVWVLHIGIFVVWIPAVLTSAKMTHNAKRIEFWKVALAGCPAWMRVAFPILFAYAILNFVYFVATTAGQPKAKHNGDPSPSDVRGFSGHWMVFYGAAFAILYSRIYAPHLYGERKCPCGRTLSITSRFCPECGYRLPDDT